MMYTRSTTNLARLGATTKLVALILAILLAESSYGGFNQFSIGLNLGSNDANNGAGARALAATDIAGVPAVAQTNWNNLPGVSGNLTGITDNNGNATAAGVTWASALGTYSSGGNNAFISVPDHTLMMGYLDNGGTATVTLTNLPAQLTTGGYDVYVYTLFDVPNRGGTYSIVDGLNPATVLKAPVGLNSDTTPTNYVQNPQTAANDTGNYLVFHGLTNANIQLVAVATNTGTSRAIICGVQLVASPEPGEAGPASGLKLTTNTLSGQLVVTWTNGISSQGALIAMRPGLPVTGKPVDGVAYNGNQNFGQGDNLGDDEFGAPNYVVYNGLASTNPTTSITVSNLTPLQTYYVAVFSTTNTGVNIDYTLASPLTGSAVAVGTLTNIALNVPTPVVIGSARHFSVSGLFDNGTAADITALASVTSSNTAIASIQAAGRLAANTNGTVAIKAVYPVSTNGGFTNIEFVTVVPMAMTYQWSFNDAPGSLVVTDSLSGAIGVVSNSPSTGPNGGLLVFDGAGGYVTLPPNILSNYGALTIELWAQENALGTWARFWDFGDNTTKYMFLTPTGGGGVLRTAFTVGGGGAEMTVNDPFAADVAVQHQFVFTLAGATRTGKLYVDGAQVGVSTSFALTPEDVGPTTLNYLGKSQYGADPYYNGSIAEFRIYNGALDAFSIAVDASTGPDIITNNPGAITSLVITAGSPIVQFGFEQVSVAGTFANLANPVDLTTSPQTTYSVSDPSLFTVDALGNLNASSPGTGTVTAVSFGMTSSVQVVVTLLPPGLTHRWSFNTDFNDSVNSNTPASPHGTVSLDGFGNATLDGTGAANSTAGSYIELPANVLLGYGSLALECWYTDECGDGTGINRNWARLWDFGSVPANNLFLTPFVGGEVDTMRLALNTNNAGEWQLHCIRPLTNVEHHVVFVENTTNLTAYLYVDGLQVAQNRNFQVRARDLGLNPNDWLGRSQYGDPLFQGLIDEFRIYNGTISPLQVALDYATGPNLIVTNPGALSSVTLVLTTNTTVGYRQPANVRATFASATNVLVTYLATNWTSSDASIARVDSYGRVTGTGPGSAVISATFEGVTASASVIVAAATPPVLTHRYSFDAGEVTDSVGGANGSVGGGTPVFANGMVTINNGTSWISLPGHLFDNSLEVTLETWAVVASATGSGTRMVDFGTTVTGPSAFAIAPSANGSIYVTLRPSPNNAVGTPSIDTQGRPAFGTTNHYAFVVSDLNRRVDIYVNGDLKDSFAYETQPDQFFGPNVQFRNIMGYQYTNMTEGWIAKNVGGTTGSGWQGSIDEFRTWSGAMNKIQARMSYLSGPENPQINPGALQTLSANLSDTTMLLGDLQHPTVTATFAGAPGNNFDLTGMPDVLFVSDNPGVVAVVNGGDSKLQAVSVGSANIIASYGGLHVTNSVSVIAKPAAILTHRYSFRGNANDAIGRANGTLVGNATIANSRLVLTGSATPPTYLRLPSDLINGYDLATFEAFYAVSAGASGSQQRLWDFGDHVMANGGITGAGYFYEAAGRGAAGLPSNSPGGESTAIAQSTNRPSFTTNTIHVAVTVDSVNHITTMYTNGVFSRSVTNPVVDLGLVYDNFSFLGRSQWNDPYYNGTIDEFRLYYGTLTPAQITASFAAGPDPETLTAVDGPGAGQVTVSWPATLVTAGYSLQTSASVSPASWGPGPATSLVNGRNQAIINTGPAPAFYRLIK